MNPAAFPPGLSEAVEATARKTIPFDYAFRYELTGKPGNVINKTVTVSIEAAFVAVSIGYGVVPKVTPVVFGIKPPRNGGVSLPRSSLARIPVSIEAALNETARTIRGDTVLGAVLKNGIKLNPDVADAVLIAIAGGASLDESIAEKMFQVVAAPPEQIQFLYAIFDEGSGREFQSDPILNIAGLGISNGDRPFRYFAQPITFAPQSTIRMEVREVSDFTGELHVSLQGYKVLGGAGTPTGRILRRAGRMRRR